jgi:hypothetical protein
MLKNIRQLHLYLGTFFAPLIIFFASTGAAQTFGLHENGNGIATQWIAKFAQVHIHQRFGAPPRRAEKPPALNNQQAAPPALSASPQGARPPRAKSSPAFKILVLLMALGLIMTTILGIIMAFKYNRDKRLIWGLLIAGALLPILMLAV